MCKTDGIYRPQMSPVSRNFLPMKTIDTYRTYRKDDFVKQYVTVLQEKHAVDHNLFTRTLI